MAFLMSGARPFASQHGAAPTRTRSATLRPPQRVQRASHNRSRAVRVSAFFANFFATKTAAPARPDPRAVELVEQILDAASRAGSGASPPPPAVAARVEELVEELAPFGVKNPARSPALWGTWEVAYCSLPTAVGGPLRTPVGVTVFPGQRARQILAPPGELVNEVTYATLGFLSGRSRQFGNLKPLSGDTFLVRAWGRRGKSSRGGSRKSLGTVGVFGVRECVCALLFVLLSAEVSQHLCLAPPTLS